MIVSKDGKGKHIIDFEGLTVKLDIDCSMEELFNPKTVSRVKYARWDFTPKGGVTDLTGHPRPTGGTPPLRSKE